MKAIWKRLKSRTYWLSILLAVSANLPVISDFLGKYYGVTLMVVAVLIAALREVTKEPVSGK